MYTIKGSLEVKLPTYGEMRKAEKRRVEERRVAEGKRKSQKKESAQNVRQVAKHCGFPLISGPGRSKSLKRRARSHLGG